MEADLVIVGAGMAAHRLVQELVERPGRPARIVLFGEEPRPAYNRVLLSPLLAGELDAGAVTLQDHDWYRAQGIELYVGDPVVDVDTGRRRIRSQQGTEVGYRQLVFATGSRPTLPDLPGIDLEGVLGFRTWSDVQRMQAQASQGGSAVVVGGGLLGLEAAEGLRKLGMQVRVLQRGSRLLNRQLDATAAQMLQHTLEERGLEILTGVDLAALQGEAGRVTAVRLRDGRCLPASLVVLAAGVTPETQLGRNAGVRCDRALQVDAQLRTSVTDVFALGECCEFEAQTYGLVAPIWRQAEVLAAVLCNTPAEYAEQAVATQLKVSGIQLFSCGEIDPPDAETLVYRDTGLGEYRRLWLRGDKLVGAVMYGDTALGGWYFEQLQQGNSLACSRPGLLFGGG